MWNKHGVEVEPAVVGWLGVRPSQVHGTYDMHTSGVHNYVLLDRGVHLRLCWETRAFANEVQLSSSRRSRYLFVSV